MQVLSDARTPTEHYFRCNEYLNERKGTYAFRRRRYDAVARRLLALGLQEGDVVVDLGAGRCEFGRYLRLELRQPSLVYLPFDGAIDGIDFDDFIPLVKADWYVAIEVLEHLHDPWTTLDQISRCARRGIVLTTPNSSEVDTLGMDETHRVPITPQDLLSRGLSVE